MSTTIGAQTNNNLYYQKRSFGLEDGLGYTHFSWNSRCVQDSLGFVWISGMSGMYRFDGNHFEFNDKNDFNVSRNGVFQHRVDVKGNNWVFEEESGQIDSIVPVMVNLITKKVVRPVFVTVDAPSSAKGKSFSGIWESSGRLYAWDIDNSVFEVVGDSLFFKGVIPGDYLIKVVNWSSVSEQLIVLTEEGVCFRKEENEDEFLKFELPSGVHDIVSDDLGVMMYTTKNVDGVATRVLHYFDFLSDSLYSLPFSTSNGELRILGSDAKGEWVIREVDEIHFLHNYGNGDIRKYASWPSSELFTDGMNPSSVTMLNGQYWFLFGAFAEIFEFRPKQFSAHLIEENKVSVRSMLNVGDSVVFFNTYSGERVLDISLMEKIDAFAVSGLELGGYGLAKDTKGNLYSGLHGRAIFHYDPLTQRSERIFFREEDKHHESGALIPFIDSTGKVWVGLERGLGYLSDVDNKLHYVNDKMPSIAKAGFNSVSKSFGSNYFWLATSIGAFLFDPYTEEIVGDLPKFRGENIVMIRQYNQDSVWVIPAKGPPYRLNTQTNVWDSLDVFKPVWQNNLHDVVPDSMGFLWLPSDNGLLRYDPFKKNFIRLNRETDGLPFNEFNKLAALTLPDGRLVFGGVGGVVSIDPHAFWLAKQNEVKTDSWVRITKATAFSDDSEVELDIPGDASDFLNIKPNTEQVEVDFAYLNPLQPTCKYFYRIQKGRWFELDQSRVLLSEIGYGLTSVEFKVVEMGTEIILGQTEIRLKKHRPWYFWNSFLLAYFVLFSSIVYGFIIWRTKRIVERNKELELLVFQRTENLIQDRATILKQRDKLEQLTKNQQRLFSILGHELRGSLLTTIHLRETIAYLLQKRRFDDLEKIAVQLTKQSSDTLQVVDQLLQWGRMVVYGTAPETTSFSLELLVNDISNELSESSLAKKITFVNEITDDLFIDFDRGAMKIILRNLIHNAIKFSPEGMTIEIKYDSCFDQNTISVADHGPGIKEEELQVWFSKQRLSLKAGTNGEKGAGLGLMICEKLANENGGKISLEKRKAVSGTIAKISWIKSLATG